MGKRRQTAFPLRWSRETVKTDALECKRITAYIPDNLDLYENLTGIQYLNFVADVFDISAKDREERIKKYGDMFEITESLGDLISSYFHGMKQKVAIISALIHEPKLMVMDEPFVGLDPKATFILKEIMHDMCKKGAAVFFSMLLTLVIPVIPMLIASFIGFLIAKISSGFKQNNIIQTVLTFVFVILCFSLQYIIEALVKNDNTKEILENVSGSIEAMGRIYLPIQWFSDAVRDLNVLAMVLLILVTAVVFEVIFGIVAKYYRQINSALKSYAASKTYKMSSQKKHSVVNAIAYKEFKRLMGSQVYMVNGAMGEVLAVILGVVALFINFEKMMQVVLKGAPIPVESLFPAIPLIVYFLIGMVATTACSPSLEGKNYWILQSLPINKKVIYQGKMLFNLYLTVPFAVFTTICFSISARVPFVNAMIYLVEIIALCCFSTAWGCVCGMKHMRLDWENEIEVVKQGTAVMLYLFPNMFVSMGMVVLVVALGMRMNANILSLAVAALALVLAVLSYRKAMKLADRL